MNAFGKIHQWRYAMALKQSPVVLAGAIFVAITAYSAPINDEPYQLRQPDGTMVDVLVSGDEFYQNVETPDGYSLVRDPHTDWICYTRPSADGTELLSTGIRYTGAGELYKSNSFSGLQKHGRINGRSVLQKRKEKYLELNGRPYENDMRKFLARATPKASSAAVDTVYGLTILVDFPDQRSQVPRDSILNWLNMEGYTGFRNNGSVRDYFGDMSMGQLVYLQQVSNFITARYTKTHYDTGTGYNGTFELINEICTVLKAQGNFDFSKITINNGIIQAVNVLYAGSPSAGWANGLWPNSGALSFTFATGVRMSVYMLSNIGTTLSIGSICHETGHMLCKFPDLYPYDDHSNGAGYYDIMSNFSSGTNPVPFGAFLRSLRGWMSVTDITKNPMGGLYRVPVNSDVAFTWSGSSTGSAQELFCIEARRRTGRSSTLPDSGLLIWHIDKSGDNTTTGKNDYAVPEQADGKFDLENKINYGNPGDLWRANNKTLFNDSTTPSSLWHNNVASGIKIANVSKVQDTMTFSLGSVITGIAVPCPQPQTQRALRVYVLPGGLPFRVFPGNADVTTRIFTLNGRFITALAGKAVTISSGRKTGATALRRGAYVCTVEAAEMKTSDRGDIPKAQ